MTEKVGSCKPWRLNERFSCFAMQFVEIFAAAATNFL